MQGVTPRATTLAHPAPRTGRLRRRVPRDTAQVTWNAVKQLSLPHCVVAPVSSPHSLHTHDFIPLRALIALSMPRTAPLLLKYASLTYLYKHAQVTVITRPHYVRPSRITPQANGQRAWQRGRAEGVGSGNHVLYTQQVRPPPWASLAVERRHRPPRIAEGAQLTLRCRSVVHGRALAATALGLPPPVLTREAEPSGTWIIMSHGEGGGAVGGRTTCAPPQRTSHREALTPGHSTTSALQRRSRRK